MEEEKIDIEKVFCPNVGELSIEKGFPTAILMDDELDEFECSFMGDGCVTIDTSKLQYLTLSMRNLHQLMCLIGEASELLDDDEN
jgi:hypothetical protein